MLIPLRPILTGLVTRYEFRVRARGKGQLESLPMLVWASPGGAALVWPGGTL